jgi:hypothetical protein
MSLSYGEYSNDGEKVFFLVGNKKKSWFLCLIVLLVKRLAPVSDFPESLVPYKEIDCLEITTSKRCRHGYRLGEITNNKKNNIALTSYT